MSAEASVLNVEKLASEHTIAELVEAAHSRASGLLADSDEGDDSRPALETVIKALDVLRYLVADL